MGREFVNEGFVCDGCKITHHTIGGRQENEKTGKISVLCEQCWKLAELINSELKNKKNN